MQKTLYGRIEEELIDRNMTVRNFLEETHMSHNTLKQLKYKKPTINTYKKIANFLNEPASQVINYTFEDKNA